MMTLFCLIWAQTLDAKFLTQSLWDDGKAEVAFYQVLRTQNQYGKPDRQGFLVGTYLVKHDYDSRAQSKAKGAGVPAFKTALFYSLESGSYEYKRHYVVNLAQADLHPFKASFTCFDWCSNTYSELCFDDQKSPRLLFRSDDYGNEEKVLELRGQAVPMAALPLWLRALPATAARWEIEVVDLKGQTSSLQIRRKGPFSMKVGGSEIPGEELELTYALAVASPIGESTALGERFVRGLDPARLMLAWEDPAGRYSARLVEHLRSAYWSEDLFPRLKTVKNRP